MSRFSMCSQCGTEFDTHVCSDCRSGKPTINEEQYKAFLSLLMASDPTPVSDAEDKLLRDFANAEAEWRGFDCWEAAFHGLGR